MNISKQWVKPMDVFKIIGREMPEHITFNPNLNKRNGATYEIVRNAKHDGTAIFTMDLLLQTVKNLALKKSKDSRQDLTNAIDVKYEVGLISLATVFGIVDLPIGRYPGEKQRSRIPIKCTLIYK